MESVLENGGHFLSKDFSTRLLNYSKNGIKNLHKRPIGMNATNEAVLTNPTYHTSPVSIFVGKKKNLNFFILIIYFSKRPLLKFGKEKIIFEEQMEHLYVLHC